MYVPVRRGLHCTCGLGKTHFDNLSGFHQYSTYSKHISKFLLLINCTHSKEDKGNSGLI